MSRHKFSEYSSKADGTARTHYLQGRQWAKDHYPEAAISVVVKDADSGFRWSLSYEQSYDGENWETAVQVWGSQSGDKRGGVAWPKCGHVRLLLEVEDSGLTSPVSASVSVLVLP